MNELYQFDEQMRAVHGAIAGVDEAGRGPLCGPVCAAAVVLNPDCLPEGLNDSKKLSEKSVRRCLMRFAKKRLLIIL